MASEQLLNKLREARSVVALTGAGVSAESGVPTFRDPDGLWAKFKPEELASIDGFMKNPDRVWEWYQHRREVLTRVKPNPGHDALVKMEAHFKNFVLVTQNVDGLHQEAGSKNVLELHGNIRVSYCFECAAPAPEIDLSQKKAIQCDCGGLYRPGVVWFGENLPEGVFEEAVAAVRSADVCFSIGTSGAVYPAAGLPMLAREAGAFTIEVNPTETEISSQFDENLWGPSGEVLPRLVASLVK